MKVSPFDSELSERASFPAYGHGHGLGVSWEGPYIAPGDKSRLQAGMCLAIECRIGRKGHGGAMFEQVGAVTESGFDQFTHARAGALVVKHGIPTSVGSCREALRLRGRLFSCRDGRWLAQRRNCL